MLRQGYGNDTGPQHVALGDTGAGFGGACVALCVEGEARAIGERVLDEYNTAAQHGRILVPPSVDSRA